jgi:hypothetical protein
VRIVYLSVSGGKCRYIATGDDLQKLPDPSVIEQNPRHPRIRNRPNYSLAVPRTGSWSFPWEPESNYRVQPWSNRNSSSSQRKGNRVGGDTEVSGQLQE